MNKVGGKRNFGWEKQMEWAGKQALRAAYGDGHYGTVASHCARWRKCCEWLREQGIRDVRQITRTVLAQFAEHLAQNVNAGMAVAYAKNLLTSVNVTLESLRGDRAIRVTPGDYLGKRSIVRSSPPDGLDRGRVKHVADKLTAEGKGRVAAVGLLCRELGLRRAEASLLNLKTARHQADQFGRINIIAGTKGGRGKSVDRWVPVSEFAKAALFLASKAAGSESKLIPGSLSLAQWLPKVSREWSEAAAPQNLGTLRDLRAAYACDRYKQLTRADAPAVVGSRIANKATDRAARTTLS